MPEAPWMQVGGERARARLEAEVAKRKFECHLVEVAELESSQEDEAESDDEAESACTPLSLAPSPRHAEEKAEAGDSLGEEERLLREAAEQAKEEAAAMEATEPAGGSHSRAGGRLARRVSGGSAGEAKIPEVAGDEGSSTEDSEEGPLQGSLAAVLAGSLLPEPLERDLRRPGWRADEEENPAQPIVAKKIRLGKQKLWPHIPGWRKPRYTWESWQV